MLSVCVRLDVNQGGTNHSCCTQTSNLAMHKPTNEQSWAIRQKTNSVQFDCIHVTSTLPQLTKQRCSDCKLQSAKGSTGQLQLATCKDKGPCEHRSTE